jgi:hypothetical protein
MKTFICFRQRSFMFFTRVVQTMVLIEKQGTILHSSRCVALQSRVATSTPNHHRDLIPPCLLTGPRSTHRLSIRSPCQVCPACCVQRCPMSQRTRVKIQRADGAPRHDTPRRRAHPLQDRARRSRGYNTTDSLWTEGSTDDEALDSSSSSDMPG